MKNAVWKSLISNAGVVLAILLLSTVVIAITCGLLTAFLVLVRLVS